MKTPTEEQRAAWNEWLAGRPDHVRKVAEKFEPWKLYSIGGPFPAQLVSFDEHKDGTVTIKANVSSPLFPRTVFGVKPVDVTPFEPGKPTRDGKGTMLTKAQLIAFGIDPEDLESLED